MCSHIANKDRIILINVDKELSAFHYDNRRNSYLDKVAILEIILFIMFIYTAVLAIDVLYFS